MEGRGRGRDRRPKEERGDPPQKKGRVEIDKKRRGREKKAKQLKREKSLDWQPPGNKQGKEEPKSREKACRGAKTDDMRKRSKEENGQKLKQKMGKGQMTGMQWGETMGETRRLEKEGAEKGTKKPNRGDRRESGATVTLSAKRPVDVWGGGGPRSGGEARSGLQRCTPRPLPLSRSHRGTQQEKKTQHSCEGDAKHKKKKKRLCACRRRSTP